MQGNENELNTKIDSLTNRRVCVCVRAIFFSLFVVCRDYSRKEGGYECTGGKKNTFGHFEYCKSHHKQIDYFFIIRFLFGKALH